MKFNLKKHIAEIKKNGITLIDGYKEKECNSFINKFEKIINKKDLRKYVDSKMPDNYQSI